MFQGSFSKLDAEPILNLSIGEPEELALSFPEYEPPRVFRRLIRVPDLCPN